MAVNAFKRLRKFIQVNVLLTFLSFVDFSLLLLASLTFAIPGLVSSVIIYYVGSRRNYEIITAFLVNDFDRSC